MSSQHYLKYGHSGPIIVFLLGVNNIPSFYDKLFTLLSEKFQIYALYYPGIGNSDQISAHKKQNYMDYIHRVTSEELQLSNYTLAGFSLGGYLACEYTRINKSQTIKQLLLFSPATKLRSKSLISQVFRNIINEFQNHTVPWGNWLGFSIFNPANFRQLKSKYLHTRMALNCHLSKEDIPDIRKLVLIGGRDLIIDSGYTEQLFAGDTQAKLINYEGLGHDAFSTIGTEIVDIVDEFVD